MTSMILLLLGMWALYVVLGRPVVTIDSIKLQKIQITMGQSLSVIQKIGAIASMLNAKDQPVAPASFAVVSSDESIAKIENLVQTADPAVYSFGIVGVGVGVATIAQTVTNPDGTVIVESIDVQVSAAGVAKIVNTFTEPVLQ